VAGCSCGALLLSGRPAKPTIHWLSRPGGGWSELTDAETAGTEETAETEATAETDDDQGKEGAEESPPRRLGYYSRPRMAVPVEEIQPPVAFTQARAASAT
jgi:hypothetical protein